MNDSKEADSTVVSDSTKEGTSSSISIWLLSSTAAEIDGSVAATMGVSTTAWGMWTKRGSFSEEGTIPKRAAIEAAVMGVAGMIDSKIEIGVGVDSLSRREVDSSKEALSSS